MLIRYEDQMKAGAVDAARPSFGTHDVLVVRTLPGLLSWSPPV